MSIILNYPRITFEANGTMTVEGPDVQVTVESVGEVKKVVIGQPSQVEQVHSITIAPVDIKASESPLYSEENAKAIQAAYAFFANDDKVTKIVKRATIKAPDPKDALFHYHGQRGLVTHYLEGASVFYFLTGTQVSMVVKTRSLVDGWVDV